MGPFVVTRQHVDSKRISFLAVYDKEIDAIALINALQDAKYSEDWIYRLRDDSKQ